MALVEHPSIGDKIRGIRPNSRLTRERLSPESRSQIWMERYESPNGMVGAVAHFGERFPRWRVDKIIRDRLKQEPSETTGFDVLYRTPEGESLSEIDNYMADVAKRMVEDALRQKGWSIDEVEVLDFTSSMGDLGTARKIATAIGIKDEAIRSGKVKVTGKYIACDGSGKALYERLSDEESRGKKVLLLSIDPVTSLMPFDPSKIDTASMQIFSNGAAVLAYQPGVDIRLLPGVGITEGRRDEGGIRAIPRYYRHIKGREDGPLFVFNNDGVMEEVTSYPYPSNENGEMDPIFTYKFFANNGAEILEKVYRMYKKQYPDREPDFVVGHHPSAQVLEGLKRHMTNVLFGGTKKNYIPTFLDKFKWSVRDGNSSGSTSLIAFARNMQEYKPGEHGIYISFGAGGSFTMFGIEIGQGGAFDNQSQSLAA